MSNIKINTEEEIKESLKAYYDVLVSLLNRYQESLNENPDSTFFLGIVKNTKEEIELVDKALNNERLF